MDIVNIATGIAIVFVIWFISTRYLKQKNKTRFDEEVRKSGIEEIDKMNTLEFEFFIKMLFKEVGFTSKEVSEDTKVFGGDLLMEGPTSVVVKLAKSGSNTKVGVKEVQEIHAARSYHAQNEAWIITNTIFTEKGERLAEICGIKLIDRSLLKKLILTTNPETDAKEVRESIRLLFEEKTWEKIESERLNKGWEEGVRIGNT